TAPQTQIQPTDYELAVKVFSKFPGSETTAVGYLEKAIANDTSRVNKMNYMGQAAELMGKAKMFDQELKWMIQQADLKGTWSELDYYKITNTAYSSKLYDQTIDLAKKYLAAFPDKPQPYSFLKRAALAADPDTTKGIALAGLDYLDSMYMKDKEKNKKEIFRNLFFRLNYYVYKTKELEKALEVTDKMLALYPEPGEENKYAADTKAIITDALNKRNQPAKPSKAGAGKAGEGPSKK
ncbi:MAG: hypothetical protein KGO81_14340, partial [Bacteroidota bacterium]|nr:hypothetical protein [Bacteroidota bacterium]